MFSCINTFVSASKKNMLEYEKNHLPMCNQFFVHGFKVATRSFASDSRHFLKMQFMYIAPCTIVKIGKVFRFDEAFVLAQ